MSIKFTCSSELIEFYKGIEFLSSEKEILGMCGESGNRIFSIGDNGDFNLFCEKDHDSVGWEKFTLSDGIKKVAKNENIIVKQFCAKKKFDKFHIVAIANCDGCDKLFVSYSTDPTVPEWTEIPFDDGNVQVKNIKSVFTSGCCDDFEVIADVVLPNNDDQPNELISRYFVDWNDEIGDDRKWHPHPLPADFDNTVESCMGKMENEDISGIYTFGSIGNIQQVIYTPLYNEYDLGCPPISARIQLPCKVDAMTTQETEDGYTNLFMCGGGRLLVSTFDNQKDGSAPVTIVKSDAFYNVKKLYAYRMKNRGLVFVWGYNGENKAFYCYGKDSCLDNADSWSQVFIHFDDVSYFCAYYNEKTESSSILAYTNDKKVRLGTQSPETTCWKYYYVSLPASEETVKFDSYTTKITVTDENGMILPNKELWLQSKDYYCVYINNTYRSLDKKPIKVQTDINGVIKIVYQTSTLYSGEFYIYENENANDSEKKEILAWNDATDRILALDSVDKIRNATIVDGNGKKKPLVDNVDSYSYNDLDAIAKSMETLAASKGDLLSSQVKGLRKNTDFRGIFVTVNRGKCKVYEGEESLKMAAQHKMIHGITVLPDGSIQCDRMTVAVPNFGGPIKNFISDVVDAVKEAVETVWSYTLRIIEGAWNFIVEIGGKIYSFVIDCVDALASGIEIIWNAIKVTMKTIIEFVKFMFNWDDIKKTADVISHLFNLQLDNFSLNIEQGREKIKQFADEITEIIKKWADIDHIDGVNSNSICDMSNSESQMTSSSVQKSYLTDYFTDNIGSCRFDDQVVSSYYAVYEDSAFKNFLEDEKEILKNLMVSLKTEFTEDISTMDFITVTKKIIGLISTALIETAENGVELILDFVKDFLEKIKDFLNKKIYIPVLSNILEEWFGVPQFSVLDVVSLVLAVPSSIGYKLITQQSLFTDEQYEYIMGLGNNNRKGILDKIEKIPNEIKNVVYVVGHVSGAMARTIELPVYALSAYASSDEKPNVIGAMSGVLTFISAALDTVGDVAYKPYEKQAVLKPIPIIFKYPPLIVSVGGKIVSFVGSSSSAAIVGETAGLLYTMGSFIDIICNVGNIIQTSRSKHNPELAVGDIELVSHLCYNVGTVLETVAKYDKETYSKTAFVVLREVSVGAGIAMDVTAGIEAHVENLPHS